MFEKGAGKDKSGKRKERNTDDSDVSSSDTAKTPRPAASAGASAVPSLLGTLQR